MKIKIVYSDLSQEVLDSKDFAKKARDDILVLWVYTDPPTKLERYAAYYVFDNDGFTYFGGLNRSETFRSNNSLGDIPLEEILKLPLHFGKSVDNETFVKASEVAP